MHIQYQHVRNKTYHISKWRGGSTAAIQIYTHQNIT